MSRTIYFGPPGTGKTTTLLQILEQKLKEGVPIDRIAFLTFTRRAKREAVERVEKTLGIRVIDLPHFRTIHAMAFRALRLKDGDVLSFKHLIAFGKAMGLTFGKSGIGEMSAEGLTSQSVGDQMMAIDSLRRLRGTSLRAEWNSARSDVDWPTMEHFAVSYKQYKVDTGLLDFTDVLMEFVRQNKVLDVDVAFIDEAQDLSSLQWLAALSAVESAREQYISGDDDQWLFKWAGADVDTFMTLEGERNVLTQSYRLPRSVHALANKIIHRVKKRVPKEFMPRDADGLVKTHANAESLPLMSDSQNWLWLVRNRYLLEPLRRSLELRGIVYSQHGMTSIVESERVAIYDWERLRTGRSVPVVRLRDLYSFLKTKTQVARGHKLIPNADDRDELTHEQLCASHGLLVPKTLTWYAALDDIPHQRRTYYRKLLRDHKSLKLPVQVQLETIHGAKGAEAPHVALFLEQSRRVWDDAQRDPDSEHRVWYVGATRAKESLHLVQTSGQWGYRMPQA